MHKRKVAFGRTICLTALLVGLLMTPPAHAQFIASAKEQVTATERAFAKTMADRHQPAFARFLSTQAVFFSGEKPTRGKSRIVERWLNYFKDPKAPFSWEPATVEVLESGNLALSSGPVWTRPANSSAPSPRYGGSSRRIPGASSSTRATMCAIRSRDVGEGVLLRRWPMHWRRT